jgi:hypothetical protein
MSKRSPARRAHLTISPVITNRQVAPFALSDAAARRGKRMWQATDQYNSTAFDRSEMKENYFHD